MKPIRLCAWLCLMLLASCSTELTRQNDRKLQASSGRASELREQLQEGQPRVKSESRAGVEKVDGIWLPFKRLSEITEQASAREAATRRITINRDFRSIQEVAERVTLLTGIPVNVAPDALIGFAGVAQTQTTTTTTTAASAQTALNPAGVPVPPLPPITGGAAPPATVAMQAPPLPVPLTVPLSYDGALSGFMDVAAARFGVSWEWSRNAINIYRYHMSIFTITAQTMSAVMKDLSDTMKSIVQKIS